MSFYITRVELHSATYQDYERLHTEMGQAGFSRTITDDKGVVYQMPTAEYTYTGSESVEVVRNAAKRAADATGRTSIVLTAAVSTWASTGMQRAG